MRLRACPIPIADPSVTVNGVLCFLEADWPLISGDFMIDGIHVLWSRLLIKQITSAATAGAIDVDAVHARLAGAFPRHG